MKISKIIKKKQIIITKNKFKRTNRNLEIIKNTKIHNIKIKNRIK
jgi:hypothetical protein